MRARFATKVARARPSTPRPKLRGQLVDGPCAVASPRDVRRRRVNWEQVQAIQIDEADGGRSDHLERLREAASCVLESLNAERLKLPMLPQAATEAIALANDPSTGMRDLGRVLKLDPLLAARVLAVANSSMYGSGGVKSLEQALGRLGTGAIRDVLYQAVSDAHIFRGEDASFLQRERAHSLSVGKATRALCRRVGLDSDYAFVCGLLHDIGRPVLHEMFVKDPPDVDPAQLPELLTGLHTVVGSRVARSWSLPPLVVEAIRRHHRYRNFGKAEGSYSQIGNVIAAADRIATHFGEGRPATPINIEKDAVFFELGLDVKTIAELVAEVAEQAQAA